MASTTGENRSTPSNIIMNMMVSEHQEQREDATSFQRGNKKQSRAQDEESERLQTSPEQEWKQEVNRASIELSM